MNKAQIAAFLESSNVKFSTVECGNDWRGELEGFSIWVGAPSGSRTGQFDYQVCAPRTGAACGGKTRTFSSLAGKLLAAVKTVEKL